MVNQSVKRDMDLVRKLLLRAESGVHRIDTRFWDEGEEGYSPGFVAKHLQLMVEAGLIEARLLDLKEDLGVTQGELLRITWTGHEFIALARDEAGWRRSLDAVTAKAGGASLEILIEYLKMRTRMILGLPGGEE